MSSVDTTRTGKSENHSRKNANSFSPGFYLRTTIMPGTEPGVQNKIWSLQVLENLAGETKIGDSCDKDYTQG